MYNTTITTALASERVNTLLAQAETHRRGRLARLASARRSTRTRAHEPPMRSGRLVTAAG